MNHQFSTGQGYPSQYLTGTRHPAGSTSATPQSHANQYPAASGSHTLPPIGTPLYGPAMGQETYVSRAQPLQPSMTTSGPSALNQPSLMPIYAPTATTYFSSDGPPITTYVHPSASHQSNGSSAPQYAPQQAQPHPAQPVVSQPGRLPDLRPMPLQSIANDDLVNSKVIRSLASAQPIENDLPPVHVVGSQGRRGILPSAAGRPPAIGEIASNRQKGPAAPTKDAEGKFPCEHCPKTYQHAKHLKRHMLRHTGVRPYTCGLCKDTFSRSDILKRHFQKCSVRRGNPSGENHLSHSRASRKAKAEEEEASSPEETITPSEPSQPSSAFATTSFEGALDLRNLDLQAHFPDSQHQGFEQTGRAEEIRKQKPSRNSSNRGSMGAIPTSTYEATSYGYSTGHVTPESITTSGAATPYTYPHEVRSNQISPEDQLANGLGLPSAPGNRPSLVSSYSTGSLPHILGHSSTRGHDLDWLSQSQFLSHDEFGQSQYHSGTVTPQHPKEEMAEFMNQHHLNFSK